MDDRLVSLDGAPDIPLQAALVIIGRHPSCDVCIDSVRISRVHCCLYRDGQKLFVRDLNSTNGVRVNGMLISDHALLRPGDQLSIANMRYRRSGDSLIESQVSLSKTQPRTFSHAQQMNTPVVGDMDAEIAAGIDLDQVRHAVEQAMPAHLAGQCKVEVNVQLPRQQPAAPNDSVA